MDDHQLIGQYAATRSDEAFALLVERHRDWVYSSCLRRVRHPDLAEDAAQAVFIALARKAPSLVNHQSLAGWLYQAARYVCSSLTKLQQRRSRHEAEVARMAALSTNEADADVWAKLAPDLEPALDRLPEKYRVALLLRFYQQKSLHEIATDLHISEPAAQKRVNRGLEKLRFRLDGSGTVGQASAFSAALAAHCLHVAPTTISGGTVASALAANAGASVTLSEGALSMMFLAKLKTIAAVAAMVLVVLGGGAALTYVMGQHGSTAMAAAPAPAGGEVAADANEAAARAAFIAPYLHDDTMAVIHLDASHVDMKAIKESISKKVADVPGIKAGELKLVQQKIDEMTVIGQDYLDRFTKAGGRHVYIFLAQSGDAAPHPAAMLFPIEAGGDANGLTDMLMSIPGSSPAVALNDHLLAICDSPQTLDDLKNPGVSRPDLQEAMKQTNGDVQVVWGANAAMRVTLHRHLDNGKGKLKTLLDTAQYAMASIKLPPQRSSVATIQFDSAEHAAASVKEWNAMITEALEQSSRNAPPGTLEQFKPMFLLTAEGSTAQLKMDDSSQSATALAVILPAMGKTKSAVKNAAVNAIKKDLVGAAIYAAENNNWPATMQAVVDKGYLAGKGMLVDPTDPEQHPFEYYFWSADQIQKLDAATTPVLWQWRADDDAAQLAVGYLDGHVEMVGSKKELTGQLEAAKAKLTGP